MDGEGLYGRPDTLFALLALAAFSAAVGGPIVVALAAVLRRWGAALQQSFVLAWFGLVLAASALMFAFSWLAYVTFLYLLATPLVLLLIWGAGRSSAYREPRRW